MTYLWSLEPTKIHRWFCQPSTIWFQKYFDLFIKLYSAFFVHPFCNLLFWFMIEIKSCVVNNGVLEKDSVVCEAQEWWADYRQSSKRNAITPKNIVRSRMTFPVFVAKKYSNLICEKLHIEFAQGDGPARPVLQSTSWMIRVTYETLFRMRGATKASLQVQQILHLPHKVNLMIDRSGSHMKCQLPCAEQQTSPSNFPKFYACHAKWKS